MASADVAFVERTLRAWVASREVAADESSARSSSTGGGDDARDASFAPTPEETLAARHLAHRLELARSVAAGVSERASELKRRLEARARETSRAEDDLALARRRLHVATHGRSALARLPMGADAGASPSVHDADGRHLARLVFLASEDPARCDALAAALNLRKTLVTDELLALSSSARRGR